MANWKDRVCCLSSGSAHGCQTGALVLATAGAAALTTGAAASPEVAGAALLLMLLLVLTAVSPPAIHHLTGKILFLVKAPQAALHTGVDESLRDQGRIEG